jgi:hypothetical protein
MDRTSTRAAGRLNENEAALALRISARLDRLRRVEDIAHKWLQESPTGLGSQLAMRQIANVLAEDE